MSAAADRSQRMKAMYEAGHGTIAVGEEFGLNPGWVSRVLRRMGTTMRPFGGEGPNHPGWKGNELTYSGAHMRVRSQRGSARKHICPCGAQAKQWAYDHSDPNEMHSELGAYSADPGRYSPMCVSCHKKADLARKRAVA